MKPIPLYLLVILGFAFAADENATDTPTSTVQTTAEESSSSINVTNIAVNATTDDMQTTTEESSPNMNVTNIAVNATTDDMPIALALRIRREPPFTIYKHRIRVSRRRPKPRRHKPRPVYGPPKYASHPPVNFYNPSHSVPEESSAGYSYSPPHGPDSFKDSVSHSVLDVSSDFNIQSIPSADYGGSKESYEVGYSPADEGAEIIPFEPGSYHYPKPVQRKKPKKHHSHQNVFDIGPQNHKDSNAPYSYSPPGEVPSFPPHASDDNGPSFSYDSPEGHEHAPSFPYEAPSKNEGPSYTYGPPKKAHGPSESSHSFESTKQSHDSSNPGYSYETPKTSHEDNSPPYSYEPPSQSHGSPDAGYSYEPAIKDAPPYSYLPPTKKPESPIGDYNYDPPSDQGGYSYPPPNQPESKDEPKSGYSYPTPAVPFTPHDTYGVPPALQPPASSYGYPILPNQTPSIDKTHSVPSQTSPPGSLYDLPSLSTGTYKSDSFPQAPNPPDSTYSFTINSNSYNSLPTVVTKTVGGPFAEPPPNHKPDHNLSTSQFPLDHDHISSTYGSPKSSYEVPIYDAVPFISPEQEPFPPNFPSNYYHNSFQTATGSSKVEVSVPHKPHKRLANRPGRKRHSSQKNTRQSTLRKSLEEWEEPSSDYLDEIIENQGKRKKKHSPKYTRGGGDLHGAFSSGTAVKILPGSSILPTISAVLSNTSQKNAMSENIRPNERSHGLSSSDIFSGDQFRKQDGLNTREEITEITLKSPNIYVANVKAPASDVTRRGSVFDETLNYWESHSLPRNHKLY